MLRDSHCVVSFRCIPNPRCNQVMAEAGKPDSSAKTKQEQSTEAARSDEILLQDALIEAEGKKNNEPLHFKHLDPADEGEEEEITRRCSPYQEREKQKSGK
ncbi:uncharacterized protein LOC110451064 [Mizuhopecten yessoensis]|uniref:uncharacterized protein LOC110451064 n=1 Tax=Mizuhopecten yessoensis TaxID=6573 RepID=UPI000B45D6E7|nr:uncharacterized protein LOC110451064 [Mizuhopecten yessoensis]